MAKRIAALIGVVYVIVTGAWTLWWSQHPPTVTPDKASWIATGLPGIAVLLFGGTAFALIFAVEGIALWLRRSEAQRSAFYMAWEAYKTEGMAIAATVIALCVVIFVPWPGYDVLWPLYTAMGIPAMMTYHWVVARRYGRLFDGGRSIQRYQRRCWRAARIAWWIAVIGHILLALPTLRATVASVAYAVADEILTIMVLAGGALFWMIWASVIGCGVQLAATIAIMAVGEIDPFAREEEAAV